MTMQPHRFAVFVKPWKTLEMSKLGPHIKDLGFDLIELPVRAGCVCQPETIIEDLPGAAQELADVGVEIFCVTADNALDDERLYEASARAGVRQHRVMFRTQGMNYWEAESKARRQLEAALPFCEQYGQRIAVQNHKGNFVASSAIGLYHLLKDFDPIFIGAAWDPAHNALEGEEPELALDIIARHLHFVNLKNGYWTRSNAPEAEEAIWQVHWTSGRQGRASWSRVARKLRELGDHSPLCFSAEYSAEHEVEQRLVEDLAYARTIFSEEGFNHA